MSVLIADYTLVIRKQSIEENYPGGTESYVRALRGLKLTPRFVCSSDAHLVNASFPTPDAIANACIWSSMFGIEASSTTGVPALACVDQIVGPDGECDWLQWRRDSSVATCAWLAGTEPGEVAAPEGWVPREHCVIEETLAQVQATADADANARQAAMSVVRATLDELEYAYTEDEPNTATFWVETDVARYGFSIFIGDDGWIGFVCVPLHATPVRRVAKLGALLRSANRAAKRYLERVVLQLEEIEEKIACFTFFVPENVVSSDIEFAIEATLDLSDDVQRTLADGRKSA